MDAASAQRLTRRGIAQTLVRVDGCDHRTISGTGVIYKSKISLAFHWAASVDAWIFSSRFVVRMAKYAARATLFVRNWLHSAIFAVFADIVSRGNILAVHDLACGPSFLRSEGNSIPRRHVAMKRTKQAGRRTAKRGAGQLNAERLKVGPAIAPGQERNTMRVRVYRALARGLMTGMFKTGEAVTLRTLASRLGTSAMPVREAVSRLIAERALVLLPNRSVIVPRMSRGRFIELTETRQMLEGAVAEAACSHATPALVRRLTEINEAMKSCIAVEDFHGALSQNVVFHFTLYQAAEKPVVLPLIEMLWLQAGPFLALSLTTPGARWTARHHQALLAAIRSSSDLLARRAIEADIDDTSAQLLKRAIFEDAADSRPPVNHAMIASSV
jgi:DNA-binding GntR family transcriptional regulator